MKQTDYLFLSLSRSTTTPNIIHLYSNTPCIILCSFYDFIFVPRKYAVIYFVPFPFVAGSFAQRTRCSRRCSTVLFVLVVRCTDHTRSCHVVPTSHTHTRQRYVQHCHSGFE